MLIALIYTKQYAPPQNKTPAIAGVLMNNFLTIFWLENLLQTSTTGDAFLPW
jgi:hypothetical protein